MDVKEFIQRQIAQVRRLCDAAMQDITPEQFNWVAPGLANPISSTFMHIVGGEDMYIHVVLLGQTRLWEREGWSAKVGIANTPGRGRGWDEIKGKPLALAPVLAYQQAVRAATDRYLADLTPEALDRKVSFAGAERTVGEVLTMLVGHIGSHAGEIAALKGVQGVQGLPF